MASNTSGGPRRHLDANAGRTVVFCHSCQNEWYEDEGGQERCPSCRSEIIELVSTDNDPRELYEEDQLLAGGLSSGGSPSHRHADDSDPEEADIEDHMQYPGGFMMNQRIWDSRRPENGAGSPRDRDRDRDPQPPGGGDRPPPAEEGDAVFRRFIDMVGGFGMNRMAPGGPMHEHTTFHTGGGGGGIRRTTFTSPNGMHTTHVTITSGPINFGAGGVNRDEFPQTFRTILAGLGPPPPPRPPQEGEEGEDRPGDQGARRGPPHDILSSLQELLSIMVDPANARHGDAVYSQEALDRIISGLMEANPQSNAAPPASESAIAGLERKKMDEVMLAKEGGHVECTVCIDEIKIDDELVFLPCKHWFHDGCVVMWLKEHNTCPICRTPIEQSNRNRSAGPSAQPQQQQQQQQNEPQGAQGAQSQPQQQGQGPQQPPFRGRAFGFPIFFDARSPPPRDTTSPTAPPPGVSSDRDSRWPNFGSRRSSLSPPNTSDSGSRTRTRSPSTNNRRSGPAANEQSSQREGGSRPFSWLRDRFGGSDRRQP